MIWIERCGLKGESGRVNSDRSQVLKFAGAMFAVALAGYVMLYMLDDATRHRQGAWEVQFATNTVGEPVLCIGQTGLVVSNLVIEFAGERVPEGFKPVTRQFDRPDTNGAPVPFGRWIYHDLMYMPGVITLELFADVADGKTNRHEIELSSRTLVVNREEHLWTEAAPLRLSRTNKFSGRSPGTKPVPSRRDIQWTLMFVALFPVMFILFLYFTRRQPIPERESAGS